MKAILSTLAGLSLLIASPALAQMRGGGFHGGGGGFHGGGGYHGGGGGYRGGGYPGGGHYGGGHYGGGYYGGGHYGHAPCCYGYYGWPYGLALGVGLGWAFAAPWYYDGYYYGYYPYGYGPYGDGYPPPAAPAYGYAAPPPCGSWIWHPETQSYSWAPCAAPAYAAPRGPGVSVAPTPN